MITSGEGAELVRTLTDAAGFTENQAKTFAPEAGSAMVDALKSHAGKLDLGDLAGAANVRTLLGAIDVGGLASRSGVSADLGAKGLQILLPIVLQLVASKAGGNEGLLKLLAGGGLGGGALGGALGRLGGMLGR
jgi:hypothetical protein